MEMYAAYIKEREGAELLVTDEGWASYVLSPSDKACLIKDVYVKPASRRKGVACELVNAIEDIARSAGCIYLFSSVDPDVYSAQISRELTNKCRLQFQNVASFKLEIYAKELN